MRRIQSAAKNRHPNQTDSNSPGLYNEDLGRLAQGSRPDREVMAESGIEAGRPE